MAKPIPENYEVRSCLVATDEGGPELRAADPLVDQPGFDGYIALWHVVDDRGTFFTPGSFKRTLKARTAVAPVLWNHDYWEDVPIGKHLEAVEDAKGVRIRVAVNEGVQRGAETMSNLRFGIPLGLSFGFDRLGDRSATDKDDLDLSVAPDWVKSAPRNELRAITEVRFWESSVVTFASNAKAKPDTVRSADVPSLLDAITAGTLTDEQRAAVEQITLAWNTRPAPGDDHGTRDRQARRNLTVELEALFMDMDPRILEGIAA